MKTLFRATRGALSHAEGFRRRTSRQQAARVPAQALRRDRLSAADVRERRGHIPGGRRRLVDAGDLDLRGLQPRLLQGQTRQGSAHAQPRHQRDLHRADRKVALRMERRRRHGVRRPRSLRRHLLPDRRGAALHERDLRRAEPRAPSDVHHRRQPAAGRVHARGDAPLRSVRHRTASTKNVASSSVAPASPRHKGWGCSGASRAAA